MSHGVDERYMRQALDLASRGLGLTSPNPAVGALVVAGDKVVGQGWHAGAGRPHAEVEALRDAAERSRGATLYVTLEPCCHHGRTPPCVDAILAAGITRVVSALHDPDPRVNGGGHALLRAHGVRVTEGILEPEALWLNRAFVTSVRCGRPLVTLKYAMTADGRSATRTAHSQWITGAEARAHVHEQRALHDAVLVGVGTVLADDPRLDARLSLAAGAPAWRGALARRARWRVVLDSAARTPLDSQVLSPALGPALICVAPGASEQACERLRNQGAVVTEVPGLRGPQGIAAVLEMLQGRGLRSVLVEGGSQVHGAFVAAGLFDGLLAYLAPCVVGGEGALPAVSAPRGAMEVLQGLEMAEPLRLGEDWLLEGWRGLVCPARPPGAAGSRLP